MTLATQSSTHRTPTTPSDFARREEIIRRYWLKGELTPLAVANSLAGQKVPQAA